MRFWLALLFLVHTYLINAQHTISGSVKTNNGESIPYASVVLFDSDSTSIVSYTLTNERGDYEFNSLNKTSIYWLQVRSLGYENQAKTKVEINHDQSISNINFVLGQSPHTLKEVLVKAQYTGIAYSGDTIKYDPKRFTDGSEVSLGDLLDRLPGVEVDQNGNVKVQGRTIEKILLNGHEFFSNNAQMATKNLSADIVEKVEVLKNYTEHSQLKDFQSDQKVVLNIGVNKNKLGKITGNIQAGGGIDNKYMSRLSLVKLTPKAMFSFIGASNNIGQATLNLEDYMKLQGGINELLGYEPSGGSVIINLTEEESNMLRPENNTFASTKKLAALNISYNPTSDLKINSYILYNGDRTKNEDRIKNTYNTESPNIISKKQLHNTGNTDMPSAYIKLNYKMSESSTINYKVLLSGIYTDKRSYINEEYTDQHLHTDDSKKNKGWNISQNISFIKSFGKHILTANLVYTNKKGLHEYKFKTDSLLLPLHLSAHNGWYSAQQEVEEHNINALLDISYLYRINENYFIKTGINPKITEKKYQTNIYTDPTNYPTDTDLQNKYRIKTNHYAGYISLLKNKGLFRFKAGLSAGNYKFDNDLYQNMDDKSRFKIQPDIELSMHFNQQHILKLLYNQSFTPMSTSSYISNLVFSEYNSYNEQSDIKKMMYRNEGYNLQYNLHDMFSNTMIYLIAGLNNVYHSKTYRFRQEELVTIQNPTLSPKTSSWFTNFYINKGLGFIPWSIDLNMDYEDNTFKNYSVNIENSIKSQKLEGKLSVNSRLRKRFNFDCFYEYKLAQNYSLKENKNIQTVQTIGAKAKYNDRKKIKAYLEAKYISNNTSSSYKKIWEISTSFRYLLNKKLELELYGENILNINKNHWFENSFNGIFFTERYFRKIPGNILLKINYKIM